MAKTLLLFLFSERVDSYVNAIAYSYDKLNIERVKLVHIAGATTTLSDAEAGTVTNRIWLQIEGLAKGEYTDFFARDKDGNYIDPPPKSQITQVSKLDIYRRIHERLQNRDLARLSYTSLKRDLQSVIQSCGGSKECLVDLTGAAKAPAIDIFFLCLALGLEFVFTFELANPPKPELPEKSLYHALADNAYRYTSLSDTNAVKAGKRLLLRKGQVRWLVVLAALLVMVVSFSAYFLGGTQSTPLQIVSLLASVVGIVTPLYSLIQERQQN